MVLEGVEILPYVAGSFRKVRRNVLERIIVETEPLELNERCDGERQLDDTVVVNTKFFELREESNVERKVNEVVV